MSYHCIRGSVNILLVRNGRILLSRRRNKSWGNGLLCIPGGHIEKGETPTTAAVREAQEELGLMLNNERLRFFCAAHRKNGDNDYVGYEFMVELADAEMPENREPDQCSELVWADPRKLPGDVIEDFRIIIERGYILKENFLEIGYDEKV